MFYVELKNFYSVTEWFNSDQTIGNIYHKIELFLLILWNCLYCLRRAKFSLLCKPALNFMARVFDGKLIFIWELSDQIRVPISSSENKFPIERFIIHLSHRVELSKIDAWRHGRQESRKWSSWNLKSWDLQNLGPEMLLGGWWFRSQNSKQTSLLTQRQTLAGSLLLGYHRPMFPDCSIHRNWLKLKNLNSKYFDDIFVE